ncbi:MAG: type II toxin-antitoxin system VapC family toxin [Acidobacteriota bacterium]
MTRTCCSGGWAAAASAWEIAIKAALGRLDFDEPPETCLPRELERYGFRPLPVSLTHALAVRTLPLLHHDPFDRLLIAQARLA